MSGTKDVYVTMTIGGVFSVDDLPVEYIQSVIEEDERNVLESPYFKVTHREIDVWEKEDLQ